MEQRGTPAGLRQASREEEVLGRGRVAPWMWCGCPPTSPLFIGARERGASPLQMDLEGGGGGQGGRLAPQAKGGGAPFRVFPKPQAHGP